MQMQSPYVNVDMIEAVTGFIMFGMLYKVPAGKAAGQPVNMPEGLA